MNDDRDPLWDATPRADESLRRMQALLTPFSARARGLADRIPVTSAAPRLPGRSLGGRRPGAALGARATTVARPRWLLRIAAIGVAALVLLVAGMAYRLSWSEGRPWPVHAASGSVPDLPLMAPGATVYTRSGQALDIEVARIGRISVSPGSTLRLVETRTGHHRVALDSGHLRARIWAPPGYFGVIGGAGEVVDLGCDFDLWQGTDGSGRLHVRSGWVAYRVGGREVLVPAGFGLSFEGGRAHTPLRPTATAAFAAATATLEHALARTGPDAGDIQAAAQAVADAAEDADGFTVLDLLTRHPALATGPLYPRLALALSTRADDPGHRAAWARGDRDAMDRWWHLLPVQPKSWWMHWADAFAR